MDTLIPTTLMSKRSVKFIKDGVRFGQCTMALFGTIRCTDEPHEDYPDPFPQDKVEVELVDIDYRLDPPKRIVIMEITDFNMLTYFLDGHDLSMISAHDSDELLELEFGPG